MALPLDILYEDSHLLFVNKPAGCVVQRGYDADEPVLYEAVRDYLFTRGEQAFLLQRLDRGTTGVIFFSKSTEMNPRLTRQFETRRIRKTYLAICRGRLGEPQLIDAPLARIGPISFGVRDGGKRALTSVTPRRAGDRHSLVEVRLLTGRTHQIRVHLAAIGHPLEGDWLYGERTEGRPMLHALRLEMRHPASGEDLVVEAPMPPDFVEMMGEEGATTESPRSEASGASNEQ